MNPLVPIGSHGQHGVHGNIGSAPNGLGSIGGGYDPASGVGGGAMMGDRGWGGQMVQMPVQMPGPIQGQMPGHLPPVIPASTVTMVGTELRIDLKEVGRQAAHIAEREAIVTMLGHTGGNKRESAERLGISYKAILYKIREFGIGRPRAPRRMPRPAELQIVDSPAVPESALSPVLDDVLDDDLDDAADVPFAAAEGLGPEA
jgi:hypothetical protein